MEATDCVADKIVHLSGTEYDIFSHNLMRDWDFIRDNRIDSIVDGQGRVHCLLVAGEGRRDGILVNSEGANYARYSAILPNAGALVIAERYPYLAERAQQLAAAADYVLALASEDRQEESAGVPHRYAVSFHILAEKFGLPFAPYDSQTNLFMAMLGDRPEIDLIRHNTEEFLIDVAPPEIVLGSEQDKIQNLPPEEGTKKEFAAWADRASGIEGRWREDTRYRQRKDGALYYIGGESGQYVRISNSGMLTAGRYDLARPGIENTAFTDLVWKQYANYERALLTATQLAGPRFTSDLFSEKPSVMDQIREARKAPSAPRKQKDKRSKDGPDL